ncbi:hypothetical protein GFO_3054 [Christiangramia forsetii KT0803]|uniref:Uncharacterized protein n=1 Tax=Christiangramia forsetii (strain DSM 17595 / CGMCC 1.15422 / KT0803) TaxID=411154 RepID=A0M5V3_CHRFK|nr:hypothetical protein GFO_3054 [Christiangramia forsetii KT0803]
MIVFRFYPENNNQKTNTKNHFFACLFFQDVEKSVKWELVLDNLYNHKIVRKERLHINLSFFMLSFKT